MRQYPIPLILLVCIVGCADPGGNVNPDSTPMDVADGDTSQEETIDGLRCGNDRIENDETCDGTNLGAETCLTQGFLSGTLLCLPDCSGFDDSDCEEPAPSCGNDVAEGSEFCDGTDLKGETCESIGFSEGELACAESCLTYDVDGCEAKAVCGNSAAEGEEVCDGTDLADATCESEGFFDGTLACAPDCQSLVTAGCTNCGNGAIDSGESCEQGDLNDQTCESLGFDGGTLSCSDACSFDRTACTFASCGNNMVDGNEDCEGTDLDGASCSSLGFDEGDLSCAPNCTFDTSACVECGDNVAEGTEECDGIDLAMNTCQDLGFDSGNLGCTSCQFDTSQCVRCGDNTVGGAELCDGSDLNGESCTSQGFTGGMLQCNGACDGFVTSGCTSDRPATAGDVVITEVMQNPDTLADNVGEYFELYNPSTTDTWNLAGCRFEDDGGESITVASDLPIPPESYVVLAPDSAGGPGFSPDYVYIQSQFQLANGNDEIRLVCNPGSGDVVVDEVLWDNGGQWPDPTGASMTFDGGSTVADIADPGLWCESTSSYNGDTGTPGTANDDCLLVDWCNLQFPELINPGDLPVMVFGRVYIEGLTDQSEFVDTHPDVIAEAGYGSLGDDPRTDPFTWVSAGPNAGWNGNNALPQPQPDNDEYEVEFNSAIPSGQYSYFYRFSTNDGRTWTYCDIPPGLGDGFDFNDAGLMDVP